MHQRNRWLAKASIKDEAWNVQHVLAEDDALRTTSAETFVSSIALLNHRLVHLVHHRSSRMLAFDLRRLKNADRTRPRKLRGHA